MSNRKEILKETTTTTTRELSVESESSSNIPSSSTAAKKTKQPTPKVKDDPAPKKVSKQADEKPTSSRKIPTRKAELPNHADTIVHKEHLIESIDKGSAFNHSKESPQHKWRLRYIPQIKIGNKRRIVLLVEAKTTESRTVMMEGEIKILGKDGKMVFKEKQFKMIVEESTCLAFKEIISHEDLKAELFGGEFTFSCDASFKTID